MAAAAEARSSAGELIQKQPRHDDLKGHGFVTVSAAAAANTQCRERDRGLGCLDEGRWREYSSKMERVRILEIEAHSGTPGVYFHIYRTTWDTWRGEFRFSPAASRLKRRT